MIEQVKKKERQYTTRELQVTNSYDGLHERKKIDDHGLARKETLEQVRNEANN